jgi:ETFB lysine methyltransferase
MTVSREAGTKRPRVDTIEQLEQSLRRQFRVDESALDIGGSRVVLLHPANAEELIDEKEFERDERLPYWADIWPSARVLGAEVLAMRGEGLTLLELGCGSGLVATCAAQAGFTVTATDYYQDALRFTTVNAFANANACIATRLIDWRQLPDDLGRYDVVVASDVLYERPYGPLVARAIAHTLTRHGSAVLADPGRIAVDEFLTEARRAGLAVDAIDRRAFHDGNIRQTITLYRLRHSAATSGHSSVAPRRA